MNVHRPPSQEDCLRVLAKIYPPELTIHLGSRSERAAEQFSSLGSSEIWLAEPQASRAPILERLMRKHANVQIFHKVFGAEDGREKFYTASLRNESGLIQPEHLKALWKNLSRVSEEYVNVTSLSTFLRENQVCADLNRSIWLSIDCLNAVNIVSGAKDQLDEIDVVIARVVVDSELPPEVEGQSKSHLDAHMALHGFKRISDSSSRSSSTAIVIYAADFFTKSRTQQLSEALEGMRRRPASSGENHYASGDLSPNNLSSELIQIIKQHRDNFSKNFDQKAFQNLGLEESVDAIKEAVRSLRLGKDQLDQMIEAISQLGPPENNNEDSYSRELNALTNEVRQTNIQLSQMLATAEEQIVAAEKSVNEERSQPDGNSKKISLAAGIDETLSIAEDVVTAAIGKEILAVYNLQNLRERYRSLARKNRKYADALINVRKKLEAASAILTAQSKSDQRDPEKTHAANPQDIIAS